MALLFPISLTQDQVSSKLKSSRLILPSISIGNVPQLAIDILIHNYDFELIARLDSTFLYPFASPIDYFEDGSSQKDGVSTALELYFSKSKNLTLIQQRSPILPSFSKNFLNYLVNFIKTFQFEDVVILDSNDYGLKNMDVSEVIEVYSTRLDHRFKNLHVSKDLEQSKLNFTPFVSHILEDLNEKVKEVSVNSVVIYVYEGDNFADAELLARSALAVLEIEAVKHWKTPKSWRGVYGDRPLPTGLEEGVYA